ncbi:MAG: WYL domain-containing protein, partial [Paracoccaceae bacterium]
WVMPPLMFDGDEIQALLVGLRMARAFTDDELARAATRAEEKLRAALDDSGLRRADRSPYAAPVPTEAPESRALHLVIRKAAEERRKLRIAYHDEAGAETRRVIHPVALIRWRAVWTLVAHCELRGAERHFRIDRIGAAEALEERFPEPPASLRAALAKWGGRGP